MTLFLSSSGKRIARRTTISLATHEPASVLTLRLFVMGQGLQCLGRHLWEMKVTVNPGSKSTFNMVCERTADMVSHTMMLNGVSLFLFGFVATNFLGLLLASTLASNTGKASSKVGLSVGIVLIMFLCMDLGKWGAFPAVKVQLVGVVR